MGKRTGSETITKILVALLERRTWNQADLARFVGVSTRTIKKRMLELVEVGVPLEHDKEHPHVYWSVPRSWFPGGGFLKAEQIAQLSRHLARHPKTGGRERLLTELLRSLPEGGTVSTNRAELGISEDVLATIEDAAASATPVWMSYFSASRGDLSERHASVHRIEYGRVVRIVATCHRDDRLKWFRADRLESARLDDSVVFRPADATDVDELIRGSFDGFRGSDVTKPIAFIIAWPEGRWAARNLPVDVVAEHRGDHLRVVIETSGLEALARHLVGLGGLVHAESPELRVRMVRIARESLKANSRATRKVIGRSVRAKRTTG